MWNIIREIENKGKTTNTYIQEIELENKFVIKDSETIAKEINKYFVNISFQETEGCNEKRGLGVGMISNSSIFCSPVNELDVSNIIKRIKNKMTSGPDGIPFKIIKDSHKEIAKPLSEIINKSIYQGKFPKALKLTKILPIQKTANDCKVSNFTPISLISVFLQSPSNS